jgi:hypothetical protein
MRSVAVGGPSAVTECSVVGLVINRYLAELSTLERDRMRSEAAGCIQLAYPESRHGRPQKTRLPSAYPNRFPADFSGCEKLEFVCVFNEWAHKDSNLGPAD